MSGPDLAPQKFILSQQFRYLMRCKKYLEKIFLSCLVSEIQLFVYIFRQNLKWLPEVQKGHQSSFLKFPITKIFFSFLQFIKVKIEGVSKCLMIFLFTFVTFSKQIAGLEKKSYSLEWPANQDKRVDRPNITVFWTGMKLGPQTCFVNKQLTDISKKLSCPWFLTWFWTG